MSGKKYIYNPEQAQFFIDYGVECLEKGYNYKSKAHYWVFGYDECQEAYDVWNSRKRG